VHTSVTAELEAFVLEEIALGHGLRSIARDDDLLASGILDSLGVTTLVAFVEQRFGIDVADEDLTPANFQTLARIEEFVARRRPAVEARR
jgi:acyl carrier protein